jgi:hypothetical protein
MENKDMKMAILEMLKVSNNTVGVVRCHWALAIILVINLEVKESSL